MKFSPKLKKAMQEIEAILVKNDIGGIVTLSCPGFSEFLIHLNTTYSCAKVDQNGIRVRAKLQEDFHGDKAMWEYKVSETAGMLHSLSVIHSEKIMALLSLSEQLDKQVEAKHQTGPETSQNQIDN